MQIVISSVEVRDTELGVMVHCVKFNKVFLAYKKHKQTWTFYQHHILMYNMLNSLCSTVKYNSLMLNVPLQPRSILSTAHSPADAASSLQTGAAPQTAQAHARNTL